MNASKHTTHFSRENLSRLPVFFNAVPTLSAEDAIYIAGCMEKFGLLNVGQSFGDGNLTGSFNLAILHGASEIAEDRMLRSWRGQMQETETPSHFLLTGWRNEASHLRIVEDKSDIKEYASTNPLPSGLNVWGRSFDRPY